MEFSICLCVCVCVRACSQFFRVFIELSHGLCQRGWERGAEPEPLAYLYRVRLLLGGCQLRGIICRHANQSSKGDS
jgi:hypothetical protein